MSTTLATTGSAAQSPSPRSASMPTSEIPISRVKRGRVRVNVFFAEFKKHNPFARGGVTRNLGRSKFPLLRCPKGDPGEVAACPIRNEPRGRDITRIIHCQSEPYPDRAVNGVLRTLGHVRQRLLSDRPGNRAGRRRRLRWRISDRGIGNAGRRGEPRSCARGCPGGLNRVVWGFMMQVEQPGDCGHG